ncbi:MAG: D-sedoheptulose 7-phosphate, partial [Prolixibacteraceae bacterium]
MNSKHILEELINRYTHLKHLQMTVLNTVEAIVKTFRNRGKVLVCGNGGSCSDADHIVGELMKSFEGQRPTEKSLQEKLKELSPERGKLLAEKLQQGLPAISLTAHNALITAITNDIGGEMI